MIVLALTGTIGGWGWIDVLPLAMRYQLVLSGLSQLFYTRCLRSMTEG